ncbi:MAG TPA: hypothetical protein HA254_01450 [Candidatus Diapherotrites archaeon]|uniref:Uncharacterized protein n=1 Tax=Candidatus Iainarchaeum sp. TaxID=3101447 RepID=A0A7J4IWW2_9ARCH|nr:hypothetical protein [Candidatus Diapherotrites archaeon]
MGKTLVAVLGIGKGTWGHVARLIADQPFEKALLISNEWGKENFSLEKEPNAAKMPQDKKPQFEWVMVNNRAGFEIIKDEIKKRLPEGEVAISLVSGSGKEHMAVLAALKEKKMGFEVVILTGNGTKYY